MVWGLEQLYLFIYGKPIKLLIENQALESLFYRNRFNKTHSARLTRWFDLFAHFSVSVSHFAGKHFALTDYFSRNPSEPPQADNTIDEEYVINNIIPHYTFLTKNSCLSNNFNHSQSKTLSKTPQSESIQNACTNRHCLNKTQISRSNSIDFENYSIMDARTIDNLEPVESSAETRHLITSWRDIVKPGI